MAPPLQLWRRRSFSGLVQDQAGLALFWEIGGFPDLLDLRQQEAPKLQTSPQLTGWKLSRVFVRLDPSLEGKIHKTCVAAPLEVAGSRWKSQNSSARRRPVSRVFSPVSSPHSAATEKSAVRSGQLTRPPAEDFHAPDEREREKAASSAAETPQSSRRN